MSEFLYALAFLACPLGMGAMMWMMMRGRDRSPGSGTARQEAEISALRAQLDQLQAEDRLADRPAAGPEPRW